MAVITRSSLWVPGDGDLLDALRARRPLHDGRWQRAADPKRPAGVAGGTWRRMSRLSRMVLATAVPLLVDRPDRETIPVIWGNAMGELVPVSRFLDRLYREGPQHVSPLNFQNSVTNAPAGHLSIALGLRGLSETVSAGGATGLVALMRGLDLLALGRVPAVLVVAGDDLNPSSERAWAQLDPGVLIGEALAAVLIEQDGDGPQVRVELGVHPAPLTLGRCAAMPGEPQLVELSAAIPPEDSLGLVPSGGLALVTALASAGVQGAVIDQDGDFALTAMVTP